MKKVLSLVLALIMVCTMAMAVPTPAPVVSGNAVTTDLGVKGYSLLYDNNTDELPFYDLGGDEVVSFTKTVVEPTVIKDGDKTTTIYTAPFYTIKESDGDTGYLLSVSSELFYCKLVKDGKVVDYLMPTDFADITTTDVVKKVINKKDTADCGDYLPITASDLVVTEDGGVYMLINDNCELWSGFWSTPAFNLVMLNGKMAYVAGTDFSEQYITHDFSTTKFKSVDGTLTAIYCTACKTYVPVVKKVAAESADLYTPVTDPAGFTGTYYYLTSAANGAAVTNPDTGANDVIGVTAALAVVALISGAAISLKK